MTGPLIYDVIVRVSKEGYRQDVESYNLQEAACVAKIRSIPNAEVGTIHYERDISGKTTNRKALREAKARVIGGEIHGLIAAYVSRFSRNTVEGLQLVTDVLEAGGDFIALDAPLDLKTKEGEAFLTMMLANARLEWRQRKHNFDTARKNAVRRGVPQQECFGYRKGPGGKLVPHPTEAKYVPQIFERRAAGASWMELAIWLNESGVTTHVYSDRKDGVPSKRTHGVAWRHGAVKCLVENRTYLGEVRSGTDPDLPPTPDAHPELVSVELFNRCQALRDLRPRRSRAEYELSGTIRCVGCGGR